MTDLIARQVSWQVGRTPIIEQVSMTCRGGLVTGLLGRNGSGKSSLLHVLAGLRRPTSGEVHLGASNVHRLSSRMRARAIALVEQDASTGIDLTVREVVELGRIPHRSRLPGPHDEGIEAVDEALCAARVEHLSARSWRTLSGGEKQRTHLARALAQKPLVLLLDEPTNHLDLRHQLEFLERVRGLGMTVVAALHDLELAAAYCDDLVVLDDGRLVASGRAGDVLTSDLVAAVYGVDADVEPHPTRDRAHVRWNGVIA